MVWEGDFPRLAGPTAAFSDSPASSLAPLGPGEWTRGCLPPLAVSTRPRQQLGSPLAVSAWLTLGLLGLLQFGPPPVPLGSVGGAWTGLGPFLLQSPLMHEGTAVATSPPHGRFHYNPPHARGLCFRFSALSRARECYCDTLPHAHKAMLLKPPSCKKEALLL